jgi:hypothetical protein
MFKYSNIKKSKNIIFSTNLSNGKTIIEDKNNDDENEKLLNLEILFKKDINIGKMIIHNTLNINLKKSKFIENIFKELTKIPNIELLTDNDDIQKISGLKNIINNLLLQPGLTNNIMNIKIQLRYYYDKLFYFINIKDKNKSHVKIQNQYFYKRRVQKRRNDVYNIPITKINKLKDIEKNKNAEEFISKYLKNENESNEEINEIKKLKKDINKERFIFIIKSLLLIITIVRLIIYIIIIYYQKKSIKIIEQILLAFYYNNHIKGVIFNVFSKINGLYQEMSGIMPSYSIKIIMII